MLPQKLENQEQLSTNLSDILTDQEKKSVIDWEIEQEKKAYVRKMILSGMGENFALEQMKNINWLSRIDYENILKLANERKHWDVDRKNDIAKKIEAEKKEFEELQKKCDANYFFNVIKKYFLRNGKFIFDDSNKKFIQTICYFFSNDPRFETELNFSFKKGLLILGDAGFGKTKTFDAIKNNPIKPISIYSMLDISEEVKDHGHLEIKLGKTILLDDVGSEEEEIKYYGTTINWLKNFIELYYHHQEDFSKLIITSNCAPQIIGQKYGYRVRSRMREMFNVLVVTGPDKRNQSDL